TKNGPRTGGRETAQQHDEKPPGWCVDAVRPGEYNGGRRTRQARKRVKRVCPDLRSTSPLGVTSTARALLLVAETDTESQFLNKDRRNGPGSSSVQPWTRLGRASRPRLAKRASPERITEIRQEQSSGDGSDRARLRSGRRRRSASAAARWDGRWLDDSRHTRRRRHRACSVLVPPRSQVAVEQHVAPHPEHAVA